MTLHAVAAAPATSATAPGNTALQQFQRHRPSLVRRDTKLPGHHGVGVAPQLA